MRNLFIPWTKLSGDAFWNHVAVKYNQPTYRPYHNMEHVVQMYRYASRLGIEYDIDLDVAILVHDMVYDEKGNNEIRSSYEFMNMMKNVVGKTMSDIPDSLMLPFGIIHPDKIIDHVSKTIDHRPIRGKDNRIILLDLYGFGDDTNVRKANFDNVFEELSGLYKDVEKEELLKNMRMNLIRICTGIVEYTVMNEDDPHHKEWLSIQNGMADQIAEIEKIVFAENPRSKEE